MLWAGCRSNAELLVEPSAGSDSLVPSVGGTPKSGEQAAIFPPVDRVTDGAVLPMPPGVTLYLVRKFMQEYEPAYQKHSTLGTEFDAVVATVRDIPVAPDAEETPVGILVKQNFERSHWVFLVGVQGLLQYLQDASKRELAMDIERTYTDRMRGLVALAKELTHSSNDEKYTAYVRSLYVETSRRHFNRELRPRDIQTPGDSVPAPAPALSPGRTPDQSSGSGY
jgi:hypothetical protein